MKINFYPNSPVYTHIIFKIIEGSKILNKSDNNSCIDFFWNGDTICSNNKSKNTINGTCIDISKDFISLAYEKVFHNKLMVDPTQYYGKVVEKSNENATHDGEVLDCPISIDKVSHLCTYQVFIDTSIEGGKMQEFRVPIIGNQVPFVYRKERLIENRFSSVNTFVEILPRESVFSNKELMQIIEMSRIIGLDVGEMDVLRSKQDGKIYVIDANRTPNGPPNGLSQDNAEKAVQILRRAFEDLILNIDSYDYKKKIKIPYIKKTNNEQNGNNPTTNSERFKHPIIFMPSSISDKFFAYKIFNAFRKKESDILLSYWYWSGDAISSLTKRQLELIGRHKRYIINYGAKYLPFNRVMLEFYKNVINDSASNDYENFSDYCFVMNSSFGHNREDYIPKGQEDFFVKSPKCGENYDEYQIFIVGGCIVFGLLRKKNKVGAIESVSEVSLSSLPFKLREEFSRDLQLDLFSLIVRVCHLTKQVFLISYSTTFVWPILGLTQEITDKLEKILLTSFRDRVLPKIYQDVGVYFHV